MQTIRSARKSTANDVVAALPLYRSAPALEVRLEDFELFAIDRLSGNSFSLDSIILTLYFFCAYV